jgi:hypothetical protein
LGRFRSKCFSGSSVSAARGFNFLHRIGEGYATLRRYAPEFLTVLKLRAAPAAKEVLDAIEALRQMNAASTKLVPPDAPTKFIMPRWVYLSHESLNSLMVYVDD